MLLEQTHTRPVARSLAFYFIVSVTECQHHPPNLLKVMLDHWVCKVCLSWGWEQERYLHDAKFEQELAQVLLPLPLFVCLFVCLYVCLFVCLFVYSFVGTCHCCTVPTPSLEQKQHISNSPWSSSFVVVVTTIPENPTFA
jgi:hypothetical protein